MNRRVCGTCRKPITGAAYHVPPFATPFCSGLCAEDAERKPVALGGGAEQQAQRILKRYQISQREHPVTEPRQLLHHIRARYALMVSNPISDEPWWFSLHVGTRHEGQVAASLLEQGVAAWIPLHLSYRVHATLNDGLDPRSATVWNWELIETLRVEPLLPGYVFLGSRDSDAVIQAWGNQVLRSSGCYQKYIRGWHSLEAMRRSHLKRLQLAKEPSSLGFGIGDSVWVRHGPRRGLMGVLTSMGQGCGWIRDTQQKVHRVLLHHCSVPRFAAQSLVHILEGSNAGRRGLLMKDFGSSLGIDLGRWRGEVSIPTGFCVVADPAEAGASKVTDGFVAKELQRLGSALMMPHHVLARTEQEQLARLANYLTPPQRTFPGLVGALLGVPYHELGDGDRRVVYEALAAVARRVPYSTLAAIMR